jgi:hypothetical protein
VNLFRRFEVRVPRDEALAATYRRVAEIVRGAGAARAPVRFWLGERLDLKRSAIDAALARFAWLAPLVIQPKDQHGRGIGNLDGRFAEGHKPPHDAPIAADQLAEVLDAIPKPCAFGTVLVLFEDLPFGTAPARVPTLRARSRSVVLPNATGAFHADAAQELALAARLSSTRLEKRSLTATIALAPPAHDADGPPPLDPIAAASVERLGPRAGEALLWQSDAAEQARLREANGRTGEIGRRWNAERDDVLRALPLPHTDLPLDPGPSTGHGYTSPHKDALVAAFAPRGFRYRTRASGQGVFKLAKPTPRGNRLSFEVDVGSWSHKASFNLRVEGPTWSNGLEVMVVPGQRAAYPIRGADEWARMVANAAVVVDHLERTLVPEIEDLRDLTPPWWRFPA